MIVSPPYDLLIIASQAHDDRARGEGPRAYHGEPRERVQAEVPLEHENQQRLA